MKIKLREMIISNNRCTQTKDLMISTAQIFLRKPKYRMVQKNNKLILQRNIGYLELISTKNRATLINAARINKKMYVLNILSFR
ncbi:hypothetical protein AKG34_03545 [Peribacillus butanolivorans]|nr:hypothetical protein AKG34_03545 [Peribacillus butanolivorans]